MSKVKHRERKKKAAAHADHGVHGAKAATLEMQGSVAGLSPEAAEQPAPRKKERRYGHN